MRFIKILTVALLSYLSAHSAAATLSVTPRLDVDYKPVLSSDEGGFWYKVEQLEFETKRSPHRIRDAAINKYLSDLVCSLAGEYCPNIRVYLIDNPHFNASMYPNGMMHVHTGLLLRLENEAQLAAILGHEIGHYLMTHHLIQYRSARDGLAVATLIDIGLVALTGVYGLATIGVHSANLSFSREHEYEADLIGLELMANAGYAPSEATKLWDEVMIEREADKSKEKRSIFWAAHPASEKRSKKLSEQAQAIVLPDNQDDQLNQKRFLNMVELIYLEAMSNHVSLQEYEQSEVLINKHKRLGLPNNLTYFFEGELHRMRAGEGDTQKAIAAYRQSTSEDDAIPAAHKQLAYMLLKQKNNHEALLHFKKYLALNPDASDKAMIEYYLSTLR